MSVVGAEELREQARDAAQRRDWAAAHDCLARIGPGDLTASDLELCADATWWLVRLEESVGLRQRAYTAFVAVGDARRAAWCAWFLWFDYRFKGDMAIASGWLTRAERHVADDTNCVEAGFVLLARGLTCLEAYDVAGAKAQLVRGLELGRRLPSPDMVALTTVGSGQVAVLEGRAQEGMAFLEALDQAIAAHIRTIHLVCDHVSTHHGKEVTRWFAKHPRFVVHFTPVHCSWMNQVEQWFSILQRKRLRIADFTSKDHLRAKLDQFICEWNEQAHPFHWSTKSVAKVMAEAPALAA